MTNVLLGKTLKAMYKLSGKTLTQLAEDSDLTIDTINNLFYARIQKPGLTGVCALVHAMGFTPQQLIGFLEENPDIPDSADITEKFTAYIHTTEDTKPPVPAAKPSVKPTAGSEDMIVHIKENSLRMEAQYQRTIDDLKALHNDEISRMTEAIRHNRRQTKITAILLGIETLMIFALLLIDALNSTIGWFR